MAICVFISADTTLKADALTAPESCLDYIMLSPTEYISLTESGNYLPVDDPAVNMLLGSIIALLALGWVFRQVLNQLFPKGN